MSTWYLDYVNGNDSNAGTSWGAAWKTITTGATAAHGLTAGDTVRIAKSPAPYSIGSATWTSNNSVGSRLPNPQTITGTASGSGSVVKLTLSSAAVATFTTGMIVQVNSVTGTIEANGIWVCTVVDSTHISLNNSVYANAWVSGGTLQNITYKTVVLSTPQTQNIDTGGTTQWNAANGGSPTLYTIVGKLPTGCNLIGKTSPAANTLYAYHATGTLNLSGYQNVSFSILNLTAIGANQWKLALCSDTAGATPVNYIPIPATPTASPWVYYNVAYGGNLGTSIKSIALYSGSSPASTSGIALCNIIACTSTGLNLLSLISTNPNEQTPSSGNQEGWWVIQGIDATGTFIMLDTGNSFYNGGNGYSGTSQTATTYARETIKTTMVAASTTAVQTFQVNGTSGNNIQYQGGWDTGTGLQTGESFFDGQSGYGGGFVFSSISYNTLNLISPVRYYYGIELISLATNNNLTIQNAIANYYGVYLTGATCTLNTLSIVNANGGVDGLVFSSSNNNTVTEIVNALNNANYGIWYNEATNNAITTIVNVNNNSNNGIYFQNGCFSNTITTVSNANYNGQAGVAWNGSGNNTISSLSTTGNNNSGVFNDNGVNYISSSLLGDSVPISGGTVGCNSMIYASNYANTANNNYIFTDSGYITTTSVTGGTAWVMNPLVGRLSNYPLPLTLATIYCEANRQVTISATCVLSSTTDIGAQLSIAGGQVAGVSAMTSVATATTSPQTLLLTFTPTAAGTVIILAQAWYIASNQTAQIYDIKTSARLYGKNYLSDESTTQAFNYVLKYNTDSVNPYITQTNQATVHAYSGISINTSTSTITLSANHSITELYDYTQDFLSLNPTVAPFFTTLDGANYVSTYNITINNGVTLTGGTKLNLSPETLTLIGTGNLTAIATDITGTRVPIVISNIVVGSNYYIATTVGSTLIASGIAASSTITVGYLYTANTSVDIRVRVAGYLPFDIGGTITINGMSLQVSQTVDINYGL